MTESPGRDRQGLGERAEGGAAEFSALTRLARVLLGTGTLCLCAAIGVLATAEDPLGGLAAEFTFAGVALLGAGLVGTAARWPPGAEGRRAMAALTVAVIAGSAGLAASALWLPSSSLALLVIGYPGALGLFGQLLVAAVLRPLLWATPTAPALRPPLPRRAWGPCVGLGLASLLLGALARLLPGPFAEPPSSFGAAAGFAVGEVVRGTAQVGLGAALLAAVLLCWLQARGPQVRPRWIGDRMEQGTAPHARDATSARSGAATASLARRLVAAGLGAAVLSGAVQAAFFSRNFDDANVFTTVGSVLAILLLVAGAAALTAGLVGLVLDRALPLLAPPPGAPEPTTEPVPGEPDEPEPEPAADADPDARWRR